MRDLTLNLMIAALLIGGALTGIAGVFCGLNLSAQTGHPKTSWHHGYRPCVTEDQETGPCFWDAAKRGNHKGKSFIVTIDGTVIYR